MGWSVRSVFCEESGFGRFFYLSNTVLAYKFFCRKQRFRACGLRRSLNRRGQRPLFSADSFGFLFVATGDESLTPQRAFRSPFGNLRGLPLVAILLLQYSISR